MAELSSLRSRDGSTQDNSRRPGKLSALIFVFVTMTGERDQGSLAGTSVQLDNCLWAGVEITHLKHRLLGSVRESRTRFGVSRGSRCKDEVK